MSEIDTSTEAVERFARRIETREPYKSAVQIAVGDHDIGTSIIVLGQGDYPTFQQIADRTTDNMNKGAILLRTLAAEVARLREALIDIHNMNPMDSLERAQRIAAEALEHET